MSNSYDVIILGAGPAGLTAALYTSRANLSVLLLDRGIYGGQMNNTGAIENYPGFSSIQGPDLSKAMYQSAVQFGVEYKYGNVLSIQDKGSEKVVKTDDNEYSCKAIVIATGSKYRTLGCLGEDTYTGRGVSYCAVCDGAFFKGKHVLVVGGGDSAIEEGEYLSKLANKVTVVHRRDQLRAQKILQDRAFKNDKMEFIWNTEVKEIHGDDTKVTSVVLHNNQTNQDSNYDVDGLFIYIGEQPVTDFVGDLPIVDDKGWIITDDAMQTKVDGIFAAGDVRKKKLRQITTAVGDGGLAGQNVFNYIQSL
ncbi:MAG: thioredoxin-disulfide reductase [Firmicutes bacterium]|uniref:Thioredoxin reductase n=1 Tax=Candidatus Gallilactobacillus intestinavium TaxID=2840838 RepID=A0A9D9H813_9LACO|nr:thioredoxin-disulfide reductase [Candidatus Gallilactobacillus intestinavium]